MVGIRSKGKDGRLTLAVISGAGGHLCAYLPESERGWPADRRQTGERPTKREARPQADWFNALGASKFPIQVIDEGSGELTVYLLEGGPS